MQIANSTKALCHQLDAFNSLAFSNIRATMATLRKPSVMCCCNSHQPNQPSVFEIQMSGVTCSLSIGMKFFQRVDILPDH